MWQNYAIKLLIFCLPCFKSAIVIWQIIMTKEEIVILTYSIGGAGAERVAANLFNNLDSEKYDIHLVLMNTEIEYKIAADKKIAFIEKSDRYESEWKKFIKLPFLAYKFARYCNKNQIKLAIAIMSRPNIIASLSKMFGVKATILISERCYTPYTYNTKTLAGKIKVALLKWAYPKADGILPNSKGTVAALQNIYNIQSNYRVVKNPTNIGIINSMKLLPVDVAIDFNKFTFINVATFREEKNQQLLIETAATIKHLPFQLVLVGKGPTLEPMKQKVVDLGLADKVIFVDFTDNPYRYMARASCFILSSYSEGFPNVLIESLVCELPIISVDCKTGPRELLAPNTPIDNVVPEGEIEIAEYGILTAPLSKASMAKAMEWAINNPQALAAYKTKSVAKGNEFEIENVCKDFSNIFDSYLTTTK